MKVLKNLLLALAGIIALFLLISFFLPTSYKVQRSIVVNASPEKIFGEVNNLKHWNNWNPWQENDSSIKITYLGPESGIGATQIWTSKDGKGSLSILESHAPTVVIYQMQFDNFEPMTARFEIELQDDSTSLVSWIAEGETGDNPLKKYFGIMMDKMMGKDYERGLANIKRDCEE